VTLDYTQTLRLEVETDPPGLSNLALNPSGEKGAWWWLTPVAVTGIRSIGGTVLEFDKFTGPAHFTGDFMPATAAHWLAARIDLVTMPASHNIKVGWDFYDVDKVFLSASAQSGALSTIGTNYVSAVQAPANTAYAKLRVNFHNGAGDPSTDASFRFNKAMVPTAPTNTFTTTRTNRVPNPSIETNTTGWLSTQDTGTTLARVTSPAGFAGSACLRLTATGQAMGARTTVPTASVGIAVTGGKDYTFSVYSQAATIARSFICTIGYYTAGGAHILTTDGAGVMNATSGWTRNSVTVTAPSNAAKALVAVRVSGTAAGEQHYVDAALLEQGTALGSYFDGSSSAAGVTYAWTGTAHASSSTAVTANFAFEEPYHYRNILGPSHEIAIERAELDPGTLQAVILDALLDPAVSDDLAPGKQIRMQALSGSAWSSIYEGQVDNANVTYRRVKGELRTTINVSAVDNIATLANRAAPHGRPFTFLSSILEDKGVPWNIGGFTGHGDDFNASRNDNASALDQIAITRDTVNGYAWVDRRNIVNVWRLPHRPPLIGNGTFEVNIDSWVSLANATLVRSTAQAHSGVASLRATANAAADTIVGLAGVAFDAIVFGPDGGTVTLTAWVRAATTGRTVTATVYTADEWGLTPTVTTSSVADSSAGWTQVSVVAPVSEYVSRVWFDVKFAGTAAGEQHYVDDVVLTHTPAAVPLFSDVSGVSYSEIDAGFDTDRLINEVKVTWLRYDGSTDTTTEIVYGPYRDQDSIDIYGPHLGEFTIHGGNTGPTESAATIEAYAALILEANKTPVRRASSLVVPVDDTAALDVATSIDLYELVHVEFDTIVDSDYRVTSLAHRIAARPGRKSLWQLELGFDVDGGVATPTAAPAVKLAAPTGPPFTSRFRSTTQTLTDATFTNIVWSDDVETTGIGYANGVFTAQRPGRYLVSAGVTFSGDATGRRIIRVTVNGTAVKRSEVAVGTADQRGLDISTIQRLAVGDTVAIQGFENSAPTTVAGQENTNVQITWLGE